MGLALAAGLSPLSLAIAAQAQGAQSMELQATQITSDQDDSPQVPKGNEVTLGKVKRTLRETPQSVSVVDHERIEQQNLFTLDETLAQTTGITVQPFVLLTTAYYARGFKIDSFELDDVPAQIGQTASSPQDMSVYERVEVLRGSNGLMHGTGNPGATVNLVRKRPQDSFHSSITLGAGSWNRYRGEVDVGGPLTDTGNIRGRVVAAYEDRDYFYDVAKQNTQSLYGITEFDLSPDTLLTLGAQYQTIDSVTNMAGVPMAADGSSLGLSRSTYLDADWDKFDWTTRRVFGSLEQQLDHGWKAKLSTEYQDAFSTLRYAGSYGAVDATTGDGGTLFGNAYRFSSTQKSADAFIDGPFQLLGQRHELMLGTSYADSETEQKTASYATSISTPVNVYLWDPSSVPKPQIGTYSSPGSTDTTVKSVYGLTRLKLADPLTLVLGARTSWWDQEAPASSFKPGRKTTPYGGLIWDFAPDWSWYASYSQVYQPQTGTTWDDSLLKPEEGDTYETGIKASLLDSRLNLSAALFRIDLDNVPQVDPEHTGATTYYISGGKVRSQGVELEGTGYLTPDWSINAGYTFTDTQYLKDTTSTGATYSSLTPRHLFKLWSEYQLPWQNQRWSVGGGLQAQSDFYTDSGTVRMQQGGYALVNARVAYRIDDHWTAAVNGNNLTDRTYYQSFSSPAWNNRYGEPRSFNLTLRGSF
ncbi:TonB-dependent siderophore receptor [Pseudomonas putida]